MLKYRDYKLIRPDISQRNRVHDLIEEFNGSVFHEFAINDMVSSAFNTRFCYLVDNKENITNFSPVHITKNRFGLKKYHFKPLYDMPYAGFLKEQNIDFQEISINFFESFSYNGFPHSQNLNKNQYNQRIGETSMIDLSLSEEEIFSNVIHAKRRNMIRKAIKSDITIDKFISDKGLETFWQILKILHQKLGYHQLNYNYYKTIFDYYKNKNQAFILIAKKEGIPVSGVFILGNNNYMHYYKGASLREIKNEGQGELLQWEAIKICKSLGVRKYDLCNLDKEKLPSIYRFKTGISNNIYQYPKISNNKLGYKTTNFMINKLLK